MNGSRFGCNFWDKHRSALDMSSVDLDGSHTPAIRGGEEVGYQGRKKRKTTNAIYLTDRKGLPLAMSTPKSGEHHDTHNIVAVMQNMMADMAKANIRTEGLFLNADAGFDCAALRSVLKSYGIVCKHLYQQKKWNGKRQYSP